MDGDFEVVDTRRKKNNDSTIERVDGEIVVERKKNEIDSGVNNVLNAVANNFENILGIATDIVEIQKIKEMSEATRMKYEEERKNLQAETECYIARLREKNNYVLSKAELVRKMMQDYYQTKDKKLSEEVFLQIIQSVINNMGIENE